MEKCIWGAKGAGLSDISDYLSVSNRACSRVGARKQCSERRALENRSGGLCRLRRAFDDKPSARC